MQIGGERGNHRADDERGQAGLQQQFAAESVRGAAQQRHRGDVAQQVPGDDRRDSLQLIDRDADGVDDVAHDGDHDIGVEGTEQDGEAARADGDSAAGVRRRHPATGGLVTWTGAFQFDSVIWTELPALWSSLA